MRIENHILYDDNGKQVPYMATPNRGGVIDPKFEIIHFTGSNSLSSTREWFLNPHSKVSAHVVIDVDGKIIQFAPFNIKCWHAGESRWGEYNGLNSYSIGIELVNVGKVSKGGLSLKHKNENKLSNWQPFSSIQIAVAKELSDLLVQHYKLKDVLGHDDIAPGRKIDPGPAFPMDMFNPKKVEQKTTTTDVNLRTGAGTGFGKVSVLPKGTVVNMLGSSDGWSRIFVPTSQLTGWVSSTYLK